MTVDAEIRVPLGLAQLARFHVVGPADNILRAQESYWLDLCLSPRPRNARAGFPDRWRPGRFERIGQVFVLPPRENMRAQSDGGPSTQASVLLHLRPDSIGPWFDGELEWTDRRLEAGLDIRSPNVRRLLLRLEEELRSPGFAGDVLVELLAAQLAIELARHCAASQQAASGGGLAPWRVRLIEQRLREVPQAPTLAELAALCKLSVRQLTRAFRVSRGRSIGEYVAQCRVDHAKALLCTDVSIKSVAYALGFGSPSSFSYAFRRATGQTPREFQARSGLRARG